MFTQYKWIVIAAAIGVTASTALWYKGKAEGLALELEAATKVVDQLGDALDASRELALKNYDLYLEQQRAVSVISEESRKKTAKINKYKNREDVVYAKPGLVERLEQKALDSFFDEVANGQ